MLTHNISAAQSTTAQPAARPLGSSDSQKQVSGPRRAEQTAAAEEQSRARETGRAQGTESDRTRREDERENVVAVSEYGDTVQVSDEGNEELEDSRIGAVEAKGTAKEPAANMQQEIEAPEIDPPPPPPPPEPPENEALKAAIEAAKEDDTDAAAAEVSSSFAGISDQQLEQMYLDGSISRYDYQTEIEAREAREEEMRSETKSLTEESAKLNTLEEQTEAMAQAVSTATSDQASEKISVEDRLDAVESVVNKEALEERREEEQGRLWDYQLTA